MKFSQADETTICTALFTAADAYDGFAAAAGLFGVAEQFRQQAKDARTLRDRIEAEGIAAD